MKSEKDKKEITEEIIEVKAFNFDWQDNKNLIILAFVIFCISILLGCGVWWMGYKTGWDKARDELMEDHLMQMPGVDSSSAWWLLNESKFKGNKS